SHGGRIYQCRQAHTSLPGWEPPHVPALWLPV
ncbi:MAG TPA: carbohydrate-binding protein, partial [Pilimelia sp.]|nr:carbohydrate-binding protein [Pilimelia sp.]